MPPIVFISVSVIVTLVVALIAFLVSMSMNEGRVPHWGILIGMFGVIGIAGWQGHALARDFLAARQADEIVASMSKDPVFDAVRSTNSSTWLEVRKAIDGTASSLPAEREMDAENAVRPILAAYVAERVSLMPDALVPDYAKLLSAIIDANTDAKALPAVAATPVPTPASKPGRDKKTDLPSLNGAKESAPAAKGKAVKPRVMGCLDALADPKAPSRLPPLARMEAKSFFISLFRSEPAYTRRVSTPRQIAAALVKIMPAAATEIKMTPDEYAVALAPGVPDLQKCRLSGAMYRYVSEMPPARAAPLVRGLAGGSMGS